MRIAIISDIHANIEGLDKAFELISKKNVDETICLGDIVGYGASPNDCIERIREHTPHVILGNHDEAALDLSKTEYFNPFARIAAEWTSTQLSDENKEFLEGLPLILERHGLYFVHASPRDPADWHYILSPTDAQENFPYYDSPLCFVGHSHVPAIFCEDVWTREVVAGKKFIVNVGSVGQPRDNDWRLSFGIFDTETWEYTNLRSEYDAKSAAQRIREAGLPDMLAQRLLLGR
jgi:predicted phosphodiesterase